MTKTKMFLQTKNKEIADKFIANGFPYMGFNSETYQFLNIPQKFADAKEEIDLSQVIETDNALM